MAESRSYPLRPFLAVSAAIIRGDTLLVVRRARPPADGVFTLEPVYCLGQCACGPSMMIDNKLHVRVTTAKFDAILQSQLSSQLQSPLQPKRVAP